MSLNAMAMPAAREPGPLVTRWRSRTVAKVVPLDTRTGNVLTRLPGGGSRLSAYSDRHEALEAVGLGE